MSRHVMSCHVMSCQVMSGTSSGDLLPLTYDVIVSKNYPLVSVSDPSPLYLLIVWHMHSKHELNVWRQPLHIVCMTSTTTYWCMFQILVN